MDSIEKTRIKHSILIPFLFVLTIWLVKLIEYFMDLSFADFGILPQKISGLKGIVFAPFIHGDFDHLISNTFPIFILGFGLFYFYRQLAWRVSFLVFVLTGLWTWLAGRESYHIGASGIVYGFAFFIFISGLLRKYKPMIAISMIVVFWYGSMFWGIFPIKPKVSWEGHLGGAVSGLVLGFFYRKQGPQRKPYDWELEDDNEDEDTINKSEEPSVYEAPDHQNIRIKYDYLERDTEKKD